MPRSPCQNNLLYNSTKAMTKSALSKYHSKVWLLSLYVFKSIMLTKAAFIQAKISIFYLNIFKK